MVITVQFTRNTVKITLELGYLTKYGEYLDNYGE